MKEEELRAQAIKRLEEKREFRQHLAIYVLVNAALSAIWYFTNSGGYFWPIWPILGWGIGLGAHAAPLIAGVGAVIGDRCQKHAHREGE